MNFDFYAFSKRQKILYLILEIVSLKKLLIFDYFKHFLVAFLS